MATTTTNLGLSKADDGEIFPLAAWKTNLDTIDTHLSRIGVHLPHDITGNEDSDNYLTWASGWEEFGSGNRVIRRGLWGFLEISANRTGAAISNGSTGDIANSLVATISTLYRPQIATPLSPMGTGRILSGYLDTNGTIALSAITNTGDFNTGHKFNVAAWYLLAQ